MYCQVIIPSATGGGVTELDAEEIESMQVGCQRSYQCGAQLDRDKP